MSSTGIRISRKGKDEATCPDKHLAFSSEYKTLQIALEGEVHLEGGYNSVEIDHNLGYQPFTIVSATSTAKNRTTALPVAYHNLDIYGFFGWYEVTTTKLIVTINLVDGAFQPLGEGTLKYYLLVTEL